VITGTFALREEDMGLISPRLGKSFPNHGMKPEKPKKAQTPAKRTRPSAKNESSAKALAPVENPIKAAVRRLKAAIVSVKKKPLATASPATAKPAAAKRTKTPDREVPAPPSPPPISAKKLAVPPILLEGDAPSAPRQSGPGQRYALGTVEPLSAAEEAADLPESYGTQRLLLVARDPHWIYAHWDLTAQQLREHNAASRDGHLILRVFQGQMKGKPLVEQHVHPESRNWFVHVGRGGARFLAELGYYSRAKKWNVVATSSATVTPPDVLSDDTSVRFETIPIEVPFNKLLELVKGAVAEHKPLVEVLQELRDAGYPELPMIASGVRASHAQWTPEQERALAQIVSIDEVRRVWMGSLEITELIRRSLMQELSSQAAAALAMGGQLGSAALGGVSSVSSPFGGVERRKGFWFNINAELIIYGATERDAAVTIGGRKIQLRPDGSFSFRFALPDGSYDLPVRATSADGSDSRAAKLRFKRSTNYHGEVAAHPQDTRLKAPRAENLA